MKRGGKGTGQTPRGMVRFFTSDEQRIGAARKHIAQLIKDDPAYRLAAIRMKRSGKLKELLGDFGGAITLESLTSDREPRNGKAGVPGRPLSDNLNPYRELLRWIDRQKRPSVKLIDWCRAIVGRSCPEASPELIEKLAKQVQRKLLDLKRRERNSAPSYGG